MMRLVLGLWLAGLAMFSDAQEAPPGTEVFLLDVADPSTPINITQRPGYDNQPAFSGDGKQLYFTSYRQADGADAGQTDIYVYDIGTGATRQFTASSESEYSPTPVPGVGAEIAAMSVVRVEADGRQLLWCLPLDGGKPTLLLPEVEPVGYHTWLSPDQLGLFVLGDKMMLQTAKVGSSQGRLLSEDIGRGLQRLDERRLAFIQNHADGPSMIAIADLATGALSERIPTRPGSEDFVVDASGSIWMAEKNRLYRLPPQANVWQLEAEFDHPGLQSISRIAVDPQRRRMALVGDE